MLQPTISWIETVTTIILVTVIVGSYLAGLGLKQLVRREVMAATAALRITKVLSWLLGFVLGGMGCMIMLFILMPNASDWIVNSYLNRTEIWQREFQSWLTQKFDDPRVRTAGGLMLKSWPIGAAFMGIVLSATCRKIISLLMHSRYLEDREFHERAAHEGFAMAGPEHPVRRPTPPTPPPGLRERMAAGGTATRNDDPRNR